MTNHDHLKFSLTSISVLDAARKLNSEMKTLICEQDDSPTPLLGSPMDGEVRDQTDTDKEKIIYDKVGDRFVKHSFTEILI